MKPRKIPMRKDLLSNEMRPKKELVRIVRNKEGEISIDPTGKLSGRGAYVALQPDLIAKAKQKKLLDAAFSMHVEDDFYDELFAYVDHQKARQELFGSQS